MRNLIIKLSIMGILLIGMPLIGVMLAGYPVDNYLEFPPKTKYIVHAQFSWTAFIVFVMLILLSVVPFLLKGLHEKAQSPIQSKIRFPWWGWLSIILLVFFWGLAWTRIPIFISVQEYTFTPLWLSYIIIVNAITYKRTGQCMLINRPIYFLALFPFSSAFWWFFEYLNRFVQNWYYVGVHYGTAKYVLLASVSFSTVLPAVLGTRDLLMSVPRINKGFQNTFSIRPRNPGVLAIVGLLFSAIGLGCIGIFPDYLFPFLWVSPLMILLSVQTLFNEKNILSNVVSGNWNAVVAAAFSALICGVFWEMWNYYSLAKWEYSVPLVHRFKIFEMPILGYAGYLPFGLECAVIGEMVCGLFDRTNNS